MRPFLRPLTATWRWLRTWPQLRWSWPRPANLVQRDRLGLTDAPAHLLPRRLLGYAGELEIANSGDGAARDVVAQVFFEGSARAGDSTVIGAKARYIVDLAAAVPPISALPDGVWVHLSWRNHDEKISGSWAQQDGDVFVEAESPLH